MPIPLAKSFSSFRFPNSIIKTWYYKLLSIRKKNFSFSWFSIWPFIKYLIRIAWEIIRKWNFCKAWFQTFNFNIYLDLKMYNSTYILGRYKNIQVKEWHFHSKSIHESNFYSQNKHFAIFFGKVMGFSFLAKKGIFCEVWATKLLFLRFISLPETKNNSNY